MQERSYVRQMPKEVGLESLKSFYNSAPRQELAMGERYKTPPKCFYVNEIGIRAVAGKCNASMEFLLDECSRSPERSVRYMAFGFLGDVPHFHPGFKKALQRLHQAAQEEKDPLVKEMAGCSLRRISGQARLLRLKQSQLKRIQ